MTFLPAQAITRWMACAGSAALEESEGVADTVIDTNLADLPARKTALEATGADVSVAQGVWVPIGLITGEGNATAATQAIVVAEYEEHSRIEVLGHAPEETKLLTLAALVKYALLHHFTDTSVGSVEELYVFGAEVTEAAALALSLRANVAALSHLTPGDHCPACRAAYRCPALEAAVHKQVFGELQGLDEPTLEAVAPRARLKPGEEVKDGVAAALARVPLIEAWIRAVRVQGQMLGLVRKPSRTKAVKRRRQR
jgi:Protein of unknown function (DUF2800)